MSGGDLAALSAALLQRSGLQGKRDIQAAASTFAHHPFPELGAAGALGDDAALLPAEAGSLLFACEGMHPGLVQSDPWFAGWSGVLVNLSDIAAMGGRPIAVVNSLWSRADDHAEQLFAGLRFACERFAVPMVGGHTNRQSPYNALSVAVLGSAPGPVLSARAARPGDRLWLLVNPDGAFRDPHPFWDAATNAAPELLRAQLALLPQLAQERLVHAAKDISMGGLVGTAVMFAEAAGLGLEIELEAIARPAGVREEAWLTGFPSFGFLLAVAPQQERALAERLADLPSLLACPIGSFSAAHTNVVLGRGGERSTLWQGNRPLTGFGGKVPEL